MLQVMRKREIAAPAEAVWATVRDFPGIGPLVPPFENIGTTDGNNEGTIRVMKSGAAVFVERLDSNDDKAHIQRYSIPWATVPVEDYTGCIEIHSLGDKRCEVVWSNNFRLADEYVAEFKEMIGEVFAKGLLILSELHAKN